MAKNSRPSVKFDQPVGKLLDHARLHEAAYHDEQADEEDERGPLDVPQVIDSVPPGDQQENARPQESDDRGVVTKGTLKHERKGHHPEHHEGLGEQGSGQQSLALVQLHQLADPVRLEREFAAEHPACLEREDHEEDDNDRAEVHEEVQV